MKKIVIFSILIVLMGMMSSCLNEMVNPEGLQEDQVAFIISDFESAEQTKSAFQMNGSELKFQWSADDAIGIFPEEGWQTEFSMEEGAGTSVAIFDGGSWGLKREAVYYAYYPFSKENFGSKDMRERVKYSYVGQEAAFADGEGVVDLSDYDFMASGESAVTYGSVSFRFKHLGALCRLRFAAPATATYSYFAIVSESEKFSMSGYFDATDKDGEGIALIADSEAGTQFKVLFPEGHQAFNENDNVELYFLMPPVDLTGEDLTITLVDSENNSHDFSIESDNIVAGMTYSWDLNYTEEATPLGANGTANSYIVSAAGAYSFPTVKGNSSESVGAVATAEVLWETYGTDVAPEVGALVSEATYSNNAITFKASDKKGNAVIAAKDAEGTILWSWHVWMTDKPMDQVYRNGAGTMMDRNLGATSATPGDVGALGLLYQWGRKDPFLGSSSISTAQMAASTLDSWPSAVSSDASCGTIEYVTLNPTTYVNSSVNASDWYYTEDGTTDDTRWQLEKTVYDPCPVGYRVPDKNIWKIAFGTNDNYPLFDSVNVGFDFGGEGNDVNYLCQSSCWYPSAGTSAVGGKPSFSTNYGGHCWACNTSTDVYAPGLGFWEGYVSPSIGLAKVNGASVRCQKIDSTVESEPEPVVATNLSADGTANSYIVSAEGTYKFSTVQGNSNTSVGAVSTAEVLWETYGTDEAPVVGALVSNVSYADNAITFNASDKKGNAVIAAKDAQGNILWSWHIWMTNQPVDQVYRNGAGTMMDRNLGATSAEPGSVGALGLFYQWGRKDPFLGSSSISESIFALSTLESWPSPVVSDATYGTIEYSVANPTVIISENKNNYHWCYSPDSEQDYTLWQSSKSVYDPCPNGYRIPDANVWEVALGTTDSFDGAYDDVNNGYNFGKSESTNYLTEAASCWYPTAGYIRHEYGWIENIDFQSYYWFCNSRSYNNFFFINDGTVIPAAYGSYASVESVRCYKENSAGTVPTPEPEPDPEPVVSTNLSENGTANSYIVSKAGTYKFSTVQGNSNTSVGAVATAEVLWETYGTDVTPEVGDLVSNVSYSDDAITFKASDKKGNAVIAAKDAQGNILWSWHIWMTDKPADQVYRNNAGTMMDRNLGAISTTPADVLSLGLLYQWGRKDPFLGISSVKDVYEIARFVPQLSFSAAQSDASTGTIDFARLNPTTYIYYNTYNNDWYYTGDESTDDTRWGNVKTIYDPCPVGYRVPDGGEDGIWNMGLGVSSGFSANFLATTGGFDFGANSGGYAITMDDTCFYPLSGYVDHDEIVIFNVNHWAFYWSCTSVGNEAYGLCLYRYEMEAYPLSKGSKAYGYSVRCQKIE